MLFKRKNRCNRISAPKLILMTFHEFSASKRFPTDLVIRSFLFSQVSNLQLLTFFVHNACKRVCEQLLYPELRGVKLGGEISFARSVGRSFPFLRGAIYGRLLQEIKLISVSLLHPLLFAFGSSRGITIDDTMYEREG